MAALKNALLESAYNDRAILQPDKVIKGRWRRIFGKRRRVLVGSRGQGTFSFCANFAEYGKTGVHGSISMRRP